MNRSSIWSFFRTILYGWILALWRFARSMCRALRRGRKEGTEPRPTAPTNCTPIDHPAMMRPDPLLYSQPYLKNLGLDVTYDNPDIVLFRGGIPVSSSELLPGATYDVHIRIWNNSLDCPVVAMPVHLSYKDFGIGPTPIPITTMSADVGVKGSPTQPASVSMPWTTPTVPGHYCLQVLLDPYDDTEPGNNLGWENTRIVEAGSAATFTFRLENETKDEQLYRFEADAYEPPSPRPCTDGESPDRRLEASRQGKHPVPEGFQVEIAPTRPTLAPGASVEVTVMVEPPAGFLGRQTINVNAFHDVGFAGGVTLTVVQEP